MPAKAMRTRAASVGLLAVCAWQVLLCPTSSVTGDTTDNADVLTAGDRELLVGLFEDFLFDPRSAQRVSINTTVRTAWGQSGKLTREGWLVRGQAESPDRVYFVDDESLVTTARHRLKRVDFVAGCQELLARQAALPRTPDALQEERFGQMREHPVSRSDGSMLARAAWLHRLGEDELAARALQQARDAVAGDDRKMVASLKSDLAWSAFAGLVHAYMVRADDVALECGERLLRLYAEEAREYPQAPAIVSELKRRQEKGTSGKQPSALPPGGFSKWSDADKTEFLIESLEEVDARQFSQPGSVDLVMDPRVGGLIKIGDAAIPALIDTIENDDRLTRSVHFWRDFSRNRTVLSVREAALEASMNILRIQLFSSRSTDDNFTLQGEAGAKRMAARLRAYWKNFGHLPIDERMMQVLTDPGSRFEATREAAQNLAHIRERRMLTTSGARFESRRHSGPRRRSNPVVAKFNNPTVAEAILAAMRRDLEHSFADRDDDLSDYRRRRVQDQYMEALIHLGDARIGPELTRLYQVAETIRDRRELATAAHQLGDAGAMQEFARDVREGGLELPTNRDPRLNLARRPATVELRGIIQDLGRTGTPEANQALYAIAEPEHSYYSIAHSMVFDARISSSEDGAWFDHAYCLKILRRELDNQELTGGSYMIEGNRVIHRRGRGSGSRSLPSWLADPQQRIPLTTERRCDRAAIKLSQLVIGLPPYHPLLKAADEKLEAFKNAFDSFRNGYRRLTSSEAEFLELYSREPVFMPDIPPLGRPATPDDVRAGRAVFHLDGKGKLSELELPAAASSPTASQRTVLRQSRLLIVQAEVDADGNTVYGVIGDGIARKADSEELKDIKTIKKSFSLFKLFR